MRAMRRGGAIVGALALAACSATDDPATGDGRVASVYEAVLSWLVVDEPVPEEGEPGDRVVFVVSRAEGPIDIDVQAAVVTSMDDVADVRFVSDWSEAVDPDDEQQAPRDDGMIVGLGAVPRDGASVEVYADRYTADDPHEAWDVTVVRTDDRWAVDGEPSAVDVRTVPEE